MILWCFSGFSLKRLHTTSLAPSAHLAHTSCSHHINGGSHDGLFLGMVWCILHDYSSIHTFHVYGMLQSIQYRHLTCQCHHHTPDVFHLVKSQWQSSQVNRTAGWISLAARRLPWLLSISFLTHIGVLIYMIFNPYSKDKYIYLVGTVSSKTVTWYCGQRRNEKNVKELTIKHT